MDCQRMINDQVFKSIIFRSINKYSLCQLNIHSILTNIMQEVNFQELNISFHCIQNNQAGHFCFNSQCKNSAIVCVKPDCKCMVDRHDECGFISVQRLISKILAKKTNLSKQLVAAFQMVDKIYTAMIQKLSKEREQLQLIRDNYGLSSQQANFLELIRSCDIEQITGKLICQIKSKVHHNNQIRGVTQENVKQYWKHFDQKFKYLISKLKAVYTDEKTIKPIKFMWSSVSERQGYTIEKFFLMKTGNHYRTNAAITQPTISFQKKNILGLKINKTTSECSIGMGRQLYFKKQQFNKFSDERYPKQYEIQKQGSANQTGTGIVRPAFTFESGDTIYLMYDPHLNQLKMSKNQNEALIIFNNIQKTEGFCFFVNGLVIGDQVEIVDEIPQIDWNRSQFLPNLRNTSNQPPSFYDRTFPSKAKYVRPTNYLEL